MFIIVAALVFSYNNSIKKKRSGQIDVFISNDQTVLLKNYFQGQLNVLVPARYLFVNKIMFNPGIYKKVIMIYFVGDHQSNTFEIN